jgi:hypothetical protein
MNDVVTQPCPGCGRPNPPGNQFCQYCGARMLPSETPAAVQPPVYVPPAQTTPAPFFTPPAPTLPPALAPNPNLAGGQTAYAGTLQIDRLGQRLDGWADLVDGAGERATAVENAFITEVQARRMPQVSITHADLTPGGLAGKRRGYALVQSYSGATMGVYITAFGKDLYLTWDLFVRPVILWRNLLIMLGIAAGLSLIPQLGDFSIFSWILNTIGVLIPVVIVALILGKTMRNSTLSFFIQEIDLFAADDITAMMFGAHHALLGALDGVGIDTTLLRKKESFYAGRRERVI